AVALGLLAVGTVPRVLRQRALVAEAGAATAVVPTVTVATARTGEATGELALPASVAGLHETGLHARSSGYVRRLLADMGTPVRAGQVLAEIETPELDQELSQARANLAQTQATLGLARATVDRLRDLVGEGAITRQDFDERQAAFEVAQAGAAAARANVERLRALKRFGQVTAPFAGVVTARNVDVGALVSPGTSAAARPLFALAQVDTVRVLASVPQSAAPGVRVGQPATVVVQELGGEPFAGRVARTAQAIDPATRTLPVEIQVANPARRLLPGMYARATLATHRDAPPLLVPANTLMMGAEGPRVALVEDGRVRIVGVTLGRDFGTEVEVLRGVDAGAAIVVNPGDVVTEGASVKTVAAPKAKGQ
ncbi:efflux RND transporter periplasmic adaptor subunit, partial [Roseisolibacter sp. H3M3-2]|uniref:efflux RND transporter periplasmic adaptor subunit n=1 Tax=Roseisolibacter sp. H3M3-2 TaxID=3031323 RepID=UPI0023DBB02C